MMKLWVFLIFLTNNLYAEVWQLGNVTYDLKQIQNGYLVNQVCIDNKKCMALEKINKLKKTPQKFGNKNPGSEICYQLQGDVFIAFQGKKSQAFCRFSDLSIISLDSFLQGSKL